MNNLLLPHTISLLFLKNYSGESNKDIVKQVELQRRFRKHEITPPMKTITFAPSN